MSPRKQRLTRDESKARTRAELLRAARRLFVRNGFAATSLADIAEEAALTKGAVYSNFDSKEDLFLALLQEPSGPGDWSHQEALHPSDLAGAPGATPAERAANWGRAVAALQPNRKNLALFLEMNAVGLRSERTRAWVSAHHRDFFRELGARLAEVLDAPAADHEVLGRVAQSLYVGLRMHEAFDGAAPDVELYAAAYRLLANLAGSATPSSR
jgi:AcrR family transcriptional regulator